MLYIYRCIDNTVGKCPSACILHFLFTSVLPKVKSFIGHFLRLALGVSQEFTINWGSCRNTSTLNYPMYSKH